MEKIKRGLEGVPVCESTISYIDGKKGKLIYRGYKIEDLALNSSFEEIAYLLWYKKLPNKKELSKFTKKLRSQRKIDSSCYAIMKKGSRQTDSMDVLNTLTSYIAQSDPDLNDHSQEAVIRKATRLTAKFPTIVAAFWRIKNGKKPIPPKTNLDSGANFLHMLTGKISTPLQARAMEIDFILTAEHGLNASTFATMVSTATESDLHSSIVSGISTLKGPLHGAARRKVYEMLEDINSPKKAKQYILQKIKKHERIMGFGHRVYKSYDPRARIFKDVVHLLAKESKNYKWYDISIEIEKTILKEFVEKKGKPIYPNVDFFTGAVYKYLQIHPQLTTGVFAMGRVPGWTAHILEQSENNRLIRPKAIYIGRKSAKYIPIEKRK